jgi:hypothetical protein
MDKGNGPSLEQVIPAKRIRCDPEPGRKRPVAIAASTPRRHAKTSLNVEGGYADATLTECRLPGLPNTLVRFVGWALPT